MTGGTWLTQNKLRPGVYINFESEPAPLGTVGDRGTVTMPLALSWGAEKKVLELNQGDDVRKVLGYDVTDVQLLLVKEALKRARTLLLYRVNSGLKATMTQGTLTVTAKYSGARGNDIAVKILNDIDVPGNFVVQTRIGTTIVDTQKVAHLNELTPNDYVIFTGILTVCEWRMLEGGTDGVATNADYMEYLRVIEAYKFNAMGLCTNDALLKSVFVSAIRRLRDAQGEKCQLVVENYAIADHEGVISVKNGVVLADGTVIDAIKAVAWVAAATAAAPPNGSLTYSSYEDAVDVDSKYTDKQIEDALRKGEFVFTIQNGRPVVEQDINTFTSFTPKKRPHYRKNRVLRVLDSIGNDVKRTFSQYYIGKVDGNLDGYNLLKAEVLNYLSILQSINAVKNVKAEDVLVREGVESDAVFIELFVQPVDAIEKIYMKVVAK